MFASYQSPAVVVLFLVAVLHLLTLAISHCSYGTGKFVVSIMVETVPQCEVDLC